MHNDQVNGRSPGRRSRITDADRQRTSCQQDGTTPLSVSVLDGFPLYSDPESPKLAPPLSAEEENLKLFKVFIKRNLPFKQPAPDLLVRIHKRIDEIKEAL